VELRLPLLVPQFSLQHEWWNTLPIYVYPRMIYLFRLGIWVGSWSRCFRFCGMTHKKAFASCEPTCIGCEGNLENVCRCPYKLQILSQLMKKDLDTQAGRLNFCSTNCISCSHRINRHCLQSLVHSLGYSSAFSGSGIICSDTSIVWWIMAAPVYPWTIAVLLRWAEWLGVVASWAYCKTRWHSLVQV
jgi:hypothetical protein